MSPSAMQNLGLREHQTATVSPDSAPQARLAPPPSAGCGIDAPEIPPESRGEFPAFFAAAMASCTSPCARSCPPGMRSRVGTREPFQGVFRPSAIASSLCPDAVQRATWATISGLNGSQFPALSWSCSACPCGRRAGEATLGEVGDGQARIDVQGAIRSREAGVPVPFQ